MYIVMEPEESQDESEVSRVTTGKAKSPGRVEWGRKLAALAKAHKEEKMAAAMKQKVEPVQEPPPKEKEKTSRNYLPWLTLGSLIIGLAALYYQRRAAVAIQQSECVVATQQSVPEKPTPKIIGMQ